jgi:hypothetical protein
MRDSIESCKKTIREIVLETLKSINRDSHLQVGFLGYRDFSEAESGK